MTYSKMNIIGKLQQWMDSVAGQTFMNYAYSWGAAVVILGTLFKLTHLPYANFFLFLGMGTEVFVFCIAAFDRPFEKVSDETENGQKGVQTVAMTPEMEHIAQRIGMLPDSDENRMIKEVFASIFDVYKQQLAKLHGQLGSISVMEEQMKIQAAYIGELNKIYGRMIDALKVPAEQPAVPVA